MAFLVSPVVWFFYEQKSACERGKWRYRYQPEASHNRIQNLCRYVFIVKNTSYIDNKVLKKFNVMKIITVFN